MEDVGIKEDGSGKGSQETRRIIIFLILTFSITYLFEIGVIRTLIYSGDQGLMTVGQGMIAVMMFVPGICVVLTRLITKEGFNNLWIRSENRKGKLVYYLMGWFGPVILTVIGTVLYFLVFPEKFDADMTYFAKTYEVLGLEMTVRQMRMTLAYQIALLLVAGPLINAATCFGEEWGWRGYLLPKMKEKLPVIPMLLVNGVIWGLWHAPLTVMGHNYGTGYAGYPFTGILAMCAFCIVLGTIFSYLTLKTGSCIPAVFAHGCVNGFAAVGIYLTEAGGNPFIGPVPTGIVGGAAFLAAAAVMAGLLVKEQKRAGYDISGKK